MFFKTSVLKVFKNFTVKHLFRSFFSIRFIKNTVQHSFLPVKFAKFLWTPFHRTPPVAASVFRKDFVDMRILMLILEGPMWLHLFYFLNKISFWFVKCLFLIDETLKLAYYFKLLQNLLCFICRFNQPLWKTRHRINWLQLFYIDELNQIKISYEIMRCQGYFFKIVLRDKCVLLL